jgi:DNA glycosylase AlkZ-like
VGKRLNSSWGQFLKPAAGLGLLAFGPDQGRNVTFVSPTAWLGKPPKTTKDPIVALGELTERWLGAFPGASREAAARWWGIASRPAMSKALAAAGADVVEVDVEGQTGWVRADDVRALARRKPPTGVRLLPGFDPFVNELPRKTDAVLPVDREELIRRTAGWVTPAVLVDGRIEGTWQIGQGAKGNLEVQPFSKLRSGAAKEIKAEADRYAAFLDRPLGVSIARPLA